MNSIIDKPPEVNPKLKLSIGSVISNPIPDDEYLKTEGNKSLYITTGFIIFDIIIVLLIFLQEYDFLTNRANKGSLYFSIKSFFTILILAAITILFWSRKYYFCQIGRFSYIILGSIYYLTKLILKLINLIKKLTNNDKDDDSEISIADIIFFFVHLSSILPRILAFFLSKKYIEKMRKLRKIYMAREQESFIEKIASRIEHGYTRWSNPNSSYIVDNEKKNKHTKHFFYKKEDEEEDNNDNIKNKVVVTLNGDKLFDDNSADNSNKNGYIFDRKDEGLI